MKPSPINFFLRLSFLAALAGFTLKAIAAGDAPATRTSPDFDAGWRFSLSDSSMAMMPEFDDAGWRQLNVPHDWSSEGPFGAQYGSGNGFAPGGIGWYRKHFTLAPTQKDRLVTSSSTVSTTTPRCGSTGNSWAGGPMATAVFKSISRGI